MRQLANGRQRLAAALAVVTLGLAACGGSDESGGADTAGSGSGDLKVGLAYDIGGRGDQSFNDSAAVGLDKAKDELGLEATESEAGAGEAESAKEERLRVLADSGHNPIIAVGFAYAGPLSKVAPEFPEVDFAIVDSPDAEGENISNLLFAEHEGSFLVGAAAALTSTTDNVGFIGGVQVPLISKFEVGFTEGAKAVKPDIEVQSVYLTQPPDFGGFNDPAKGRTAAQGMFDGGADVVYHAAGGSGGGLFEAAKAADALAIGVDSDQYETAAPEVQDVILTSMVKRVDVAVFDFLSSAAEGEVEAGPLVYDLEQGGVDYSTSGGQVDDIKTQLDEYKQKIVSGEIEVTDPTA